MNLNEAIEHARKVAESKRADADWNWRNGRLNSDDCIKCAEEHEQLAKWLEELQQYRAIGTVEECREAREKQMAKKPVMKPFYEDMEEEYLCCPNCGYILTDRIPMDNKDFYFHCLNCGQKFDWTDTP